MSGMEWDRFDVVGIPSEYLGHRELSRDTLTVRLNNVDVFFPLQHTRHFSKWCCRCALNSFHATHHGGMSRVSLHYVCFRAMHCSMPLGRRM